MICIDANILLEVIQKRARLELCRDYLASNKDIKAITTLSLDIAMYFIEKDKLAWQPAKIFLDQFSWLPLLPEDARWAFARFDGKDFEDALQVGCALREGCERFVTLDQGLARKYKKALPIDLIGGR